MKKVAVMAVVSLGLAACSGGAFAHDRVRVSVSIGVPPPVYSAPGPVHYYPPPVYHAPPAVAYYPAYWPRYGYVYGPPHHRRHRRHRH